MPHGPVMIASIADPVVGRQFLEETAVEAEHAPRSDFGAGAKALFGMGSIGKDRDDQPFGLGAEASRPALEALRRPVGIAPMGLWHMIGIGAVAPATIAALMAGDTPTFVKDRHHPLGDADIDLAADQTMGHGVQGFLDLPAYRNEAPKVGLVMPDLRRDAAADRVLDMVVRVDTGKPPDRKLIGFGGQRS